MYSTCISNELCLLAAVNPIGTRALSSCLIKQLRLVQAMMQTLLGARLLPDKRNRPYVELRFSPLLLIVNPSIFKRSVSYANFLCFCTHHSAVFDADPYIAISTIVPNNESISSSILPALFLTLREVNSSGFSTWVILK